MIAVRADELHAAVLDRVTDRDRAWFEVNPSALWYARPAAPHELCVPGWRCVPVAGLLVHVRQVAPGLRARMAMPR